MRVLVVEDDVRIAEALQAHLAQQGHAVDRAGDVEHAWRALRAEAFDLVLLDLGLPGADGSVLLQRLRQAPAGALPDPQLPVLVMTARDEVASRIGALDAGADDYVTKPFDPDELAARMRALRRRAVGRGRPRLRVATADGMLTIDPAARQVHRDGQPVALGVREFALLLALVEASPRVLSRGQLEAALYGFDQVLESNALEVHVHHLRRKLGDGVIRTVRGVGYFVPEVQGEA